MYPFLRLAWQTVRAARQQPLPLDGVHVSQHICWPWDTDMFGEMNNGRVLTIFDLGRIPTAQRTGLLAALRRRGWGLTMAGASVRYRQRILTFKRYEMHTRCIGHDGRFFYLQQSMWREGDCHASILYRAAVTGARRMVPVEEVLEEMGATGWGPALPGWVDAWSAAEAQRVWPPEV
ncbi:acyl-CoA thioesterase [Pontivivens ytuae]|uniref:Acyl-CoA thioesterase n=1 Tax=Pontivivens ytuae TaxID=2789856 RepID=A0A7S9LSB5_9RHOB|nr:acyl-CoA thioesterase [Pontivivens ytuae]QPH54055.1 acyl-CoA thioesterase [Pontivivens ytuae]